MGIHGDFGNERVADAYRTMIGAARKHRKFPGMAGVLQETIMPRYVEMGARFVLGGHDAAFTAAGAAEKAAPASVTESPAAQERRLEPSVPP